MFIFEQNLKPRLLGASKVPVKSASKFRCAFLVCCEGENLLNARFNCGLAAMETGDNGEDEEEFVIVFGRIFNPFCPVHIEFA